ncbi:signal recognition particle-docking protein FtsY [Methanobrevibacter arboriphilus]|uniref:Signal recognition particle-docking protein FtsY n=1 Tax=Methanobrevibacter arboriphilus TaxID=39441 RepID=A0ACA8R2Y9_METAZ|nr:signal recognition particle-docking protein FtsY [Methanobrevibacter arboriphilus]BBL61947.1 signal recognition particle-docking protein FtsY [Methanobrevibacter arboriphilus]GLI11059.1 signal recognition particle-docking protein FtsY [Methanobrevibacter arboriphilus]
MFESIKKKFAEASGKLTKKVSEEAEEENNVKLEEKADEVDESTLINQHDTNKDDLINYEKDNEKSNDYEKTEKDISSELNSSEDEFEVIEDKETTFSKISEKLRFKKPKADKSDDKIKIDRSDVISKSDKPVDEKIVETETDISSDLETSDDEKKKSGIFSFIREKTISEKDLEDILWELELSLLESDVAIDVANFVVESVREDLIGQKIKRSSDVDEYTYQALRNAVSKIIDIEGKSMTDMIEEKKKMGEPLVVMFVGINGTGKTTTIGKLANYYIKKGYTPVVAASDTFRAGAIEQINYHTDKLNVKLIKHEKGSDPAAVAFDAVEHAKAKGKELVLIDTAGRMQTNTNLMDEMKKIRRVAKPDLVVFVGDALTGNDAVEQATKFNDAIDIDGVILTKADADSKGGASLSIGYVIGKPILFLGIGQGYDDIKEYDPDWMLDQIFS